MENIQHISIAGRKCLCLSRKVALSLIQWNIRILVPMLYLKLWNYIYIYRYIYIYIYIRPSVRPIVSVVAVVVFCPSVPSSVPSSSCVLCPCVPSPACRRRLPSVRPFRRVPSCPVVVLSSSLRPSRRPFRRRRPPSCPSVPVRPVVVRPLSVHLVVRPSIRLPPRNGHVDFLGTW